MDPIKRAATQEDLDANPELVEQGINVGDEIEIPEGEDIGEGNDTEQ